jgi:hypothetical protein
MNIKIIRWGNGPSIPFYHTNHSQNEIQNLNAIRIGIGPIFFQKLFWVLIYGQGLLVLICGYEFWVVFLVLFIFIFHVVLPSFYVVVFFKLLLLTVAIIFIILL